MHLHNITPTDACASGQKTKPSPTPYWSKDQTTASQSEPPVNERWSAQLIRLTRTTDARASDDEEAYLWRQRLYQDARKAPPLQQPVRLRAVGDVGWIPARPGGWLSPAVRAALGSGDLAIGVLDTPVAPLRPVARPGLRAGAPRNASIDLLEAWAAADTPPTVWAMHTAHARALGHDGQLQTARALDALGMRGVGADAAGGPVRVIDTPDGTRWGLLAINATAASRAGGLPLDLRHRHLPSTHCQHIQEAIALLRRQRVDLIVATVRWGRPLAMHPGLRQRAHAATLIRLGVDVLIGHGSHIPQDAEIASIDGWDAACPLQITRHGPPRAGLIVHDLGTFASLMTSPQTASAPLLDLHLQPARDPAHPGLASLGVLHATLTASRPDLSPHHHTLRLAEVRAASNERQVRRHLRPVSLPLGPMVYPNQA